MTDTYNSKSPYILPGMLTMPNFYPKNLEYWNVCDGSWMEKSDYPELYSAISGKYGETKTAFRIPFVDKLVWICIKPLPSGPALILKNKVND